ncbi:MAG TPA: DsbA family protein [Roseiflexaceae bacterium]|nr:DsbA family protein [Roseiflexaceae bacterium]
MNLPTIEIYSSIDCPFAYLAVHRLRQVWPAYEGRVRVVWRALALEYVNREGTRKPLLDAEVALMPRIDPSLPVRRWPRPDWEWPVTFWPAFEALACAQVQGADAAFAMSWALRHAFFAEGRSPALRHELLQIASEVAAEAPLDLARFEADWDSGRYKASVVAESRRGWEELRVPGSPTFLMPDGRMVEGPAVGELDFDERALLVRRFTPYPGDPLDAYRALLEEVEQHW